MLYLQADHLFYSKLGSEDASIETMTRHVQRVNAIYKNIGTAANPAFSLFTYSQLSGTQLLFDSLFVKLFPKQQ